MRVTFSSREEAGQKLGRYMADRRIAPDMVVGLPRGGVVVAAEVARILQKPLEVLVVRKIGHPRYREFAVGALAEGGVVRLDRAAMEESKVDQRELDAVIAEETARAKDYQARFRTGRAPQMSGKSVLIVDDGLATGATTEAAIASARKQNAREVLVAVPVASPGAVERLRACGVEVAALMVDPDFVAVGQYYEDFPQTKDEEVAALLHAAG